VRWPSLSHGGGLLLLLPSLSRKKICVVNFWEIVSKLLQLADVTLEITLFFHIHFLLLPLSDRKATFP